MSALMRDQGVLDDAAAQSYAPAPRLTVSGVDGFSRDLNDVIRSLTAPQRTCECVLWEYSPTLKRMVVVDAATVVLGGGND